eukprot:gene2336-2688_t
MQFIAPLFLASTALLLHSLHNKKLHNYEDVIRENRYNISFTDSEQVKAEVAFFHIMRTGKQDAIFGPKANASARRKFLLFMILLSGDVNLNPGPRQVKYPCPICEKAVHWKQRGISCDNCMKWYHVKCLIMSTEVYEALANTSVEWICCNCGLPNFSSTLFNEAIPESSNGFENLSPSQCYPGFDENETSTPVPDIPRAHSSPKPSASNGKKAPVKKSSIKIMTVNCRSIRSTQKQNQLLELIAEHNPDVICGTESHLDNKYTSAEVFPENYSIARKDRVEGGGGVFVATHQRILSTEESSLDTQCESKWIKIALSGSKPIFIGCFYRQPSSNVDPLLELEKSLNALPKYNNSLPNVLLTGDFNAPNIEWEDVSIQPNPEYGYPLTLVFSGYYE